MQLSPSSSPTIYVVDDDDAVRESVRFLLESFGMTVRDYADAQAFIDAEKPARHLQGRNCCLLLDLHMPGMSGADLLEHLQASGIPIPAIVLTGRSSTSLRERVERAGALALLEKPAEESDLSREIARALAIASGD